jgi:hypothetical protein
VTIDQIKELAGHRDVSPWVIKLVQDAVEIERENCAKVCDAVDSLIATIQTVGIPNVGARKVLNKACEDAAKCAAAIRGMK